MKKIELEYILKSILQTLSFCLIAVYFTACGNDDPVEPVFNGSDNYIVSFELIKDGITWPVAISGTELVVSVPLNVDLNGATAKVVLTESTAISPNPQEIKDWSADWQFLVTSLQEEDRIYKYSVDYTDIVTSGDVVLNTQEEVDRFAEIGIRKIQGNLIIGSDIGENRIENLEGLLGLEEITGMVRILGSYKGNDLAGLENLQSLGSLVVGELETISVNTTLNQINLPQLKEIKGNIFIHCPVVETLGMESMTTLSGSLFIKSDQIEDINMPLLKTVGGDILISGTTDVSQGGTIEYFYLPSIEEIKGSFSVSDIASLTGIGFPQLQSVGDIRFSSLPLLSSIVMNELKGVKDIVIESCPVMQGLSFPNVQASGTIDIQGCSSLSNLMFDELTECKGDLRITQSTALGNLSGFGNLKTIEGELYLYSLFAISNLEDLKSLKNVSTITLSYLASLKDLDLNNIEFKTLSLVACQSPSVIKGPENFTGSISVSYLNTYGGDMPVFEGFKYFNGDLTLSGFSTSSRNFELHLPDMETISNLTLTTCTYCYIIDAPKLKEIEGTLSITNGRMKVDFPVLERIGKQLTVATATNMAGYNFPELKVVGNGSVSGNVLTLPLIGLDVELPKLQEVNGSILLSPATASAATLNSIKCPVLTKVDGNLQIGSTTANSTLNDLNFEALRSVAGKVTIQRFSALFDFSTFSSLIDYLEPSQWSVLNCGYNPTWEEMKNGEYSN